MRSPLLLLLIVAALGYLATGGGCVVRGPTPAEMQHDGSIGAAIGTLVAGPAGGIVGSLLTIAVGVVLRSSEKGRMVVKHAQDKVALTDKFAQALAGIATTQTYRASSEALQKKTTPPPTPTQEAAQ